MSVQASHSHYSTPRVDNADKYTAVECGFPSKEEPLLNCFAERIEGRLPTELIYAFVPTHVVEKIIERHGGVIRGDVPQGVRLPMTSRPSIFKKGFRPCEDGEEEGYFGSIFIEDGCGRCYVKTPYFKEKVDAEKYTRELCEANETKHKYETNIWFHKGEWK